MKELTDILYGPEAQGEDATGAIAKKCEEYAAQAAAIQEKIDAATETLATSKAALRRLLEDTIPAFMAEVGISSFTTFDGLEVSVKPFCRARLVPEHAEAGLKWLEDNGYGGVIKHEVVIPFGRDPGPDYQLTLRFLAEEQVLFNDVTTVHPQTLTAMMRELLARGETVPAEPFGLYTGTVATIKAPK